MSKGRGRAEMNKIGFRFSDKIRFDNLWDPGSMLEHVGSLAPLFQLFLAPTGALEEGILCVRACVCVLLF